MARPKRRHDTSSAEAVPDDTASSSDAPLEFVTVYDHTTAHYLTGVVTRHDGERVARMAPRHHRVTVQPAGTTQETDG